MNIFEIIEYDVEIDDKIYKFLIKVNDTDIDTVMCVYEKSVFRFDDDSVYEKSVFRFDDDSVYEKSVFRFDDDSVYEIEKGAYALVLKDGYYYVGSYPYNMSADYTKLTKEIIRDKDKLKQRLEEIATKIDKERAEYEEKRNKK